MGTAKQLNTNELITKLQELEKENARLRKILDVHGIPYVIAESTVSTKENQRAMAPKLSLQEKVALFRSVFQGREEVFAKRWYSPTTQKSGYQPVCEREWNREFCDKRKYKCADCPNRQFAPLSYGYTYNHLAGKDEYIALPRGCEDAVLDVFMQHGVAIDIDDKTNHGKNIDVEFNGQLRDEQQEAMNKMLSYHVGTLSATTAFGKTVFAISMIAKRKVNTLILVHNKALLEQWKKRLEDFLDINEEVADESRKRKGRKSVVGCLCSGKNTLHGIIDIALIRSCLDNGEAKPFVQDYGMVVVDECHHVSSVSFEQVLRQVRAHYVYGLTATPIRKDGHQPIIFMQCGKIRYSSDAKTQMLS